MTHISLLFGLPVRPVLYFTVIAICLIVLGAFWLTQWKLFKSAEQSGGSKPAVFLTLLSLGALPLALYLLWLAWFVSSLLVPIAMLIVGTGIMGLIVGIDLAARSGRPN
jgi:hypothetical protein